MVSRRVRHHLEVVGCVLVVRGHEQRYNALQEGLGGSVVAEEGVAVDVVKVAVVFRRTAGFYWSHVRHVEAEQLVQPVFDSVPWPISGKVKIN